MSFGADIIVPEACVLGVDGRDPATIGNIQSRSPSKVFENLISSSAAPPAKAACRRPATFAPTTSSPGGLRGQVRPVPRPGGFGFEHLTERTAWKSTWAGRPDGLGEIANRCPTRYHLRPPRVSDLSYYSADRIGAEAFTARRSLH